MTSAELQARALTRAYDQHVHIFSVPGRPGVYTTRSRSEPGRRYNLVVDGDTVACSCPGFQYREMCKHVEGLRNRLAREWVAAGRGRPESPSPGSQHAVQATLPELCAA